MNIFFFCVKFKKTFLNFQIKWSAALSAKDESIANASQYSLFIGFAVCKDETDEKIGAQNELFVKFDRTQTHYETTLDGMKCDTKYIIKMNAYSTEEQRKIKRTEFDSVSIPMRTYKYSYPLPLIQGINVSDITATSAKVE